MPLDDLSNEGALIAEDLPAQGNVKIFERNRKEMSAMEPSQSFNGCGDRSAIANASKIGMDTHVR